MAKKRNRAARFRPNYAYAQPNAPLQNVLLNNGYQGYTDSPYYRGASGFDPSLDRNIQNAAMLQDLQTPASGHPLWTERPFAQMQTTRQYKGVYKGVKSGPYKATPISQSLGFPQGWRYYDPRNSRELATRPYEPNWTWGNTSGYSKATDSTYKGVINPEGAPAAKYPYPAVIQDEAAVVNAAKAGALGKTAEAAKKASRFGGPGLAAMLMIPALAGLGAQASMPDGSYDMGTSLSGLGGGAVGAGLGYLGGGALAKHAAAYKPAVAKAGEELGMIANNKNSLMKMLAKDASKTKWVGAGLGGLIGTTMMAKAAGGPKRELLAAQQQQFAQEDAQNQMRDMQLAYGGGGRNW